MGEEMKLTADVVDEVSLSRALQDVDAANRRVIALAQEILNKEERIVALESEVAELKRLLDPRRRAEHLFRKNHTVYAVARRAKRMMGK